MATLMEIDEGLQLERELNDTTARIHSSEPKSPEEQRLLVQKQQAIIARWLELDPPPPDPFDVLTQAGAEENEARSAAWRAADLAYLEKRRDLTRELSKADPTLAPGLHEALQTELQALRPPALPATP